MYDVLPWTVRNWIYRGLLEPTVRKDRLIAITPDDLGRFHDRVCAQKVRKVRDPWRGLGLVVPGALPPARLPFKARRAV